MHGNKESLEASFALCVVFVKVRRLKLNMQYKETHYTHESKKREKEYERLKQKFSQVGAKCFVYNALSIDWV